MGEKLREHDGRAFVNLPAKIREYNEVDYCSFSASTNLVNKPYRDQSEEDCLRSWPDKIGDFTPEELGVDKSSTVWRPVKMRDMYGSPIPPELVYEAKYKHEVRKVQAGAGLYVRGITFKDNRFNITVYLDNINLAIDGQDLKDEERFQS